MDESSLVRLDLRAPLLYANAPDIEPFCRGRGEVLFCFGLDPVQSRSIEPERSHFWGDLIFAGQGEGDGSTETVELPAGLYLFVQKKKALGREDCVDLAIEQQKDGLWERLQPGNRVYVRYLHEDGSAVTQLFRPYSGT